MPDPPGPTPTPTPMPAAPMIDANSRVATAWEDYAEEIKHEEDRPATTWDLADFAYALASMNRIEEEL